MTATRTITEHILDAEGQVLGRLATKIADLLRGKGKVGFTYHQDHGDRVVVRNAAKIVVTGQKRTQKKYYRHSGYPGNLKEVNFETLIKSHPERIIHIAVKSMLPDNRLRNVWLKRLVIESEKNG